MSEDLTVSPANLVQAVQEIKDIGDARWGGTSAIPPSTAVTYPTNQKPTHSVGTGGGGAFSSVSINPQDPDNIFLGCDMQSAFVSRNAGQSFNPANFWDTAPAWYFNPHDENIAYTSTLDALYITHDKGKTWDYLYPQRKSL